MITIGRTWIKRCGFTLRYFLNFSVHFRRGGLINPDRFLHPAVANGVQNAKGSQSVDISCVFWEVEWDFDVSLSSEIVDLSRFNFHDDFHQTGAVSQVAVVQVHGTFTMRNWIGIQMLNSSGIERTRSSHDPVDFVAFGQQQFGQIRSILKRGKEHLTLNEIYWWWQNNSTCPVTPVMRARLTTSFETASAMIGNAQTCFFSSNSTKSLQFKWIIHLL